MLHDDGAAGDDSAAARPPPVPADAPPWMIVSPGALLAILALINFLNYVDRTVLGGLVPFLRKPGTGLGLTSSQIGLLQAAFMVVHSIASIPLGLLADRTIRKRLIAGGVAVWSVATAAAGFARSFGQLFAARAAVGIGEAAYAPAASALISDRFPAAQRARAMGVFQLGTFLGGAVGITVGGLVAARWGWRMAFFVVGVPGVLLTLLVLLVHEPAAVLRQRPSISLRFLLERPVSLVVLSGILTSFFTGALLIWAPEFILRELYGGDTARMQEVMLRFGPLVLGCGLAGVTMGSLAADRLEQRYPGRGHLLTCAGSIFLSGPFAVAAFLFAHGTFVYVVLGLAVFFATFYVGPILAALHSVVPGDRRATATGAYFFAIHAVGDSWSPWIVGKLDDLTGSLRPGLVAATAVFALAGFAALVAIPAAGRLAQLKAARTAE